MIEKFRCLNCYGDRCHEIGNLKICDYCGSKFSDKRYDFSDAETTYLNNAILERKKGNFDESSSCLETLINENNNVAEYYYQNLLAKLGVNFVDDNGNKKITVSRLGIKNVFELNDAKKALELAPDEETREQYKKEFSAIENIRDRYIKIANKCEKYDVFICFKEKSTVDEYARTEDSEVARELYDFLKSKNISTFYSPISLKKVVGEDYEPIIYHALHSAKIMFVISATPTMDYLNSPWVKNEWSRFISLMTENKSSDKTIIPVLANGVTIDSLPSKLSCKQALVYDGHFYDSLEKNVLKKMFFNDYGNSVKDNERINVFEVEEKIKNSFDENKKSKNPLLFIVPLIAVFFLIIIISIVLIINKKVSVTFESSDVLGLNYSDISYNLKEQGFKNIVYEEVTTGWEKSGSIIGISIDGYSNFKTNDKFKNKSEIVISYSSLNRIDTSSILKNWYGKDYLELKNAFSQAGFTNIQVESTITNDYNFHNNVFELVLNGIKYSDGDCFLPDSAPIVIKYYAYLIKIGYDSNSINKIDKKGFEYRYLTLVDDLQKKGFTNITLLREEYTWVGSQLFNEQGNIYEISLDGIKEFTSEELFEYNCKIIIKVKTDKGKDYPNLPYNYSIKIGIDSKSINKIDKGDFAYRYLALIDDLQKKGFTNITLLKEEYESQLSVEEGNVYEISLDGIKEFSSQDYFEYDCEIKIKVKTNKGKDYPGFPYEYSIEIGIDSKSINKIDKGSYDYRYLALVDYLQQKGFTNIALLREEYTWVGSQLFSEEGNIYEISLDGIKEFSSEDFFENNCEIIIKVKTNKGKDYPELPYRYLIEIGIDSKSINTIDKKGFDYRYLALVDYLQQKGFTNITLLREEYDSQLSDEEGNVYEISIDGIKEFSSEDNFEYDCEIIIKVKTNKGKDYPELPYECSIEIGFDSNSINEINIGGFAYRYLAFVDYLQQKGFTNITLLRKEYESQLSDEEGNIYEISLDGIKEFTSDYLFEYNCEIIIKVKTNIEKDYPELPYEYSIEIGIDSKSINKIDKGDFDYRYLALVDYLQQKGFTNITLLREEYTWFGSQLFSEEGNIYEISLNGIKEFSSGDLFENDCEIIIKVKTNKGKDYPELPAGN